MNLASDYPNNALSAGPLIAISVTMAAVLAIWLIMVFRADSQQGSKPKTDNQPKTDSQPEVAARAETSEDKHNDAGQLPAGSREGAAT